jgi:hypothetical protein
MVDDNANWPYNPASSKIAKVIDWSSASKEALSSARPGLIRKLDIRSLQQLQTRFTSLWELLPPDCKDAAQTVISGGKPATVKAAKNNKKDELLAEVEEVMADSIDDGSLRLKAIELKAKLESLLNVKDTEDRNIVINVITGVNREGA